MTINSLVSVIIAAYNHEKYIAETIRSIINQTYDNIELIIIDDGSSDHTAQKIRELEPLCCRRFQKFSFETQPNAGLCTTINRLLAKSEGKYIYMIASDDIAKPEAISEEVGFLEQNPDYVLVVGDNQIIDTASEIFGWDAKQHLIPYHWAEHKTVSSYWKKHRRDVDFKGKTFGDYYSLLKGNYIPNGYCIRKTALDRFVFRTEAPLEDLYMMLQLSKIGKFKYLDKILFAYRIHGNNTIHQKNKMKQMQKQTLMYELSHSSDKAKILKHMKKTKNYFKIKNIISLSRTKLLDSKIYTLELFNKTFTFKAK